MTNSEKITLQIVLSSEARNALHENGYLCGDKSRSCFSDSEQGLKSYQWMAEQMLLKLGEPPEGIEPWPLWAWYYKDEDTIDANDEEYEDQDLWIITFEAIKKDILLSNFCSWHQVLNQAYLADESRPDEGWAEYAQFDKELKDANVNWRENNYPPEFMERIEKSWNRIFDTNKKEDGIQATFWMFKKDQILKEEPCKGTVLDTNIKM